MSHTHIWQTTVRRDISAEEVSPEQGGIPSPLYATQSRVPVLGREVPVTSVFKNQLGVWLSEKEGVFKKEEFFLKGLHVDLLGLIHSEFHGGGGSSKDTRDIQGKPELPGIRMRAFSQTEVLAEATVPFLGHPSTELAGRHDI